MILAINRGKIISTKIQSDDLIYVDAILYRDENLVIENALLINGSGINNDPTIGSECFIIYSDNDTSQPYCLITINNQNTPTLKNGCVVYGKENNKVLFMDDGSIDIISGNNKILLNNNSIEITGNVKISGNLEISGNLDVSGDSTLTGSGTKIANKVFLTHTHSGVMPGGGITGGVV